MLMFMKHMRSTQQPSTILRIALSWAQADCGVSWSIFENTTTPLQYMAAFWLLNLREYLKALGLHMQMTETFVPRLQRQVEDQHLMDIVLTRRSPISRPLTGKRSGRTCWMGLSRVPQAILGPICSTNQNHHKHHGIFGDKPYIPSTTPPGTSMFHWELGLSLAADYAVNEAVENTICQASSQRQTSPRQLNCSIGFHSRTDGNENYLKTSIQTSIHRN
jgi:hypothetical protein